MPYRGSISASRSQKGCLRSVRNFSYCSGFQVSVCSMGCLW